MELKEQQGVDYLYTVHLFCYKLATCTVMKNINNQKVNNFVDADFVPSLHELLICTEFCLALGISVDQEDSSGSSWTEAL